MQDKRFQSNIPLPFQIPTQQVVTYMEFSVQLYVQVETASITLHVGHFTSGPLYRCFASLSIK